MTCPICGKAPEAKYRPFCSRRCADIDLGRWLTESYRVPAEDSGEETGPAEDGTLERALDAAPVPRPKRPQ